MVRICAGLKSTSAFLLLVSMPSRAGDVRASCGARLSSASDGGCPLFRPRLLARRRRASRRGWRQGSIRAERRRDASVGRRWLCLRTLLWDSRAGGGGGLRSAAGGGDRSFLAIELHAGVRLAVPGDAGACAARPRVPRKFLSQTATDDDDDDGGDDDDDGDDDGDDDDGDDGDDDDGDVDDGGVVVMMMIKWRWR